MSIPIFVLENEIQKVAPSPGVFVRRPPHTVGR